MTVLLLVLAIISNAGLATHYI